jgi:hypothetical protein
MKKLTLAECADYVLAVLAVAITFGFPVWHWLFGLS